MPAYESAAPDDLQTLYRHHHGWLFGWLRRRLGGSDNAADLAHDTYVRVMVSGRTPTAADSRAHLMQIAKGLVIDQHRRRVIEQAWLDTLAHLPAAMAPSPEERALMLETLTRIDAALGRLPAKVRETFLLSQIEGLTYSAIAEQLGIAVATVRKHMLKGLIACHDAFDGAVH